MSMRLDQLSEQLFAKLGMSDELENAWVSRDPPALSLELDGGLDITLKEELTVGKEAPGQLATSCISPCISLSTRVHRMIGQAGDTVRSEQIERLMEANLFGIETRGMRLGLDGNDDVTLQCEVPAEPSFALFYDTIEDFANTATYWREQINSWGAS